MVFPTKNDHFRVFWGYHHLRKHPYLVHFGLLYQVSFAKTKLEIPIYSLDKKDTAFETKLHQGSQQLQNTV